MKKIFLLALFLTGCAGMQMAPTDPALLSKGFVYIKTIPFSKEKAFPLALAWVSKSYVNAKAVLDVQDKDSGIIAGNGVGTAHPYTIGVDGKPTTRTWDCRYSYSFRIDLKDEKARIVFESIKADYGIENQIVYDGVKAELDRHAESFFNSMSYSSDF